MVLLNRSPGYPYFFINGDLKQEIIQSIDNVTSYYVDGYERTTKYQSGQWDGKEHLLRRAKNGSYYFPFGLLRTVTFILNAWSVRYEIIDGTKTDRYIDEIHPVSHSGKIILRDYQIRALVRLRGGDGAGVIALPTGAGKTVLALYWMELVSRKTLIIVHRKELLNQWVEEIKKHTNLTRIGIINDSQTDSFKDCDVIVCMVQSLNIVCMVQSLNNRIKNNTVGRMVADLIIMDECHTSPAKTVYDVLMKIDAPYRLGLSATPKRVDGAELKIFAACGTIVDSITVENLVDSGYLAKPEFVLTEINTPICGRVWSDVYKRGIVLNEDRNRAICETAIRDMEEGRQVYIHVNQILHLTTIHRMIRKMGYDDVIYVHGSTPKKERDDIIKRFRSGEIRILVSTLLKEGVSIDGITSLIYAAGMKSEVSVIQTIGRCLRVDETFQDARIYDYVDTGNHFLIQHSQERMEAYRENYGKYFER